MSNDLYFYESTEEMIRGVVSPPGIFLKAAEVLKRQLFAFCLDNWVVQDLPENVFPEKTKGALDAVETNNSKKFPKMVQDYGGVGESLRKVRRVGNLWVIAPSLEAQIQGCQLGNAVPEFGVRQHVLSRFGMGIADVVTGIP